LRSADSPRPSIIYNALPRVVIKMPSFESVTDEFLVLVEIDDEEGTGVVRRVDMGT
jgi:hypothetical protein